MKNSQRRNEIPKFKTEADEREFWLTHDTTEYFDVKTPLSVDLSNLKPSTKTITIRVPETLLYNLKRAANKRDIPYQSLVKMYLADRVKEEIVEYKA